MKITKIEGYALSSPYGDGKSLGQPLGVKSIGLIEVETDEGLLGIGETYAGVYAPELIAPTARFLGGFLLGEDSSKIDEIHSRFDRIPFIGRNGLVRSVMSAIDLALWDIQGKKIKCPVYRLLGKNPQSRVKVYASAGSVVLDPSQIEGDVRGVIERGHKAYKMRVGYQDWKKDLKRIEAARRVLGEDKDLMIDAIMGTLWPPWTADVALQRIKDLSPFKPSWLEEPIRPDDLEGMQKICKNSPIPIAGGEAFSGLSEFETFLRGHAVHILQPDVTHCGGITPVLKIAQMAKASDIPLVLHVWGSASSLSANCQLAFASPEVIYLEIPMVQLEISPLMFVSPPVFKDGFIYPPEAPGLGIQVSPEMKDKYRLVPGSGYRLNS